MADAQARELLAYARELERRDELLARELGMLDDVQQTVDAVRARAPRIEEFRLRLPDERTRVARRLAEAEVAVAAARRALGEAEAALGKAEAEGRADAVVAARDALADARADADASADELAEARSAEVALERDAAAYEQELPELADRARAAAGLLGDVPRAAGSPPAPAGADPAALAEWASRARAATFVARSTLESQRDALIREANEAAAGALGEPLSATAVALVRRRLERELG